MILCYFQTAMAHLLIPIWLELQVTIAKNEVTNPTILTQMGADVKISFTLDFVDGVSDGWTVVITTNLKLDRIVVCMAGVYMYLIITIDIRIFLKKNHLL